MLDNPETVGDLISTAPEIQEVVDGWEFEGQHYSTYEAALTARRLWEVRNLGGASTPVSCFDPPRREDTPPLLAPGIYFNMPDHVYFGIPALSTTGIKKLAASPMLFWADSWMNPEKARVEKDHHFVGHVYHCRLLEGTSVFASRYVLEIDRSNFPVILETTDQIKDYISKLTFEIPVDGVMQKRCYEPVKTVEEDDGQGGTRKRAAKKEDWVKQLLDIQPDSAPLWDEITKRFDASTGGKRQISAKLMKDVEISARMIENDPEIAPLVKGGYAEVVLIWHCARTGVPMKAKVDKLKIRRMVDLKTFENSMEQSPKRAIARAIANNRYAIQPCVYWEGAAEVRKIVREQGVNAIHVWPNDEGEIDEELKSDATAYALKWAKHTLPDEWTWVFQQKGPAPITRAVDFLQGSGTKLTMDQLILMTKRRFVEFATAFGTDPWLDLAPREAIADEDLPIYATEI